MKKLYARLSFALLLLTMCTSLTLAQERTVTGTVKDESDAPLPGVNVLIKGTSSGTTTDVNGKFSLVVPSDDAVLVFTFVGFSSSEVPVGTRSVINITLAADTRTLEELVVTGYAIQEKKDITGAVGIVKTDELIAIPASTPEAQIQGRVAGVNVVSTGSPGAGSTVRIRGISTLSGASNPLYIVDGVPTYDLTTFSSYDIESITILKDAGAASIYGARASNGVIVVTTKKGTSTGKMRISYDMFYGVQDPGKGISSKLLTPQEYANLEWLATKNDGDTPGSQQYGNGANPVLPDYILAGTDATPTFGLTSTSPEVNPALYTIEDNANLYQIVRANKAGTDWYDEMTRMAPIQAHNLSLSGGNSETGKYYLGLNYFDQQGILIESYSKRFSLRANTEFSALKNKLRIGENFMASYRTNPPSPRDAVDPQAIGTGFENQVEDNPISQSIRIQTIIPVRDIMGNYAGTAGYNFGNGANPVAQLERTRNNRAQDVRLFGNAYAELDLIRGLTARTSFGGSFQNAYSEIYEYRTYEAGENIDNNRYTEIAQYRADWVWTNTLTFNKTFGDNMLTVLGGTEAVKRDIGRTMQAGRLNYFIDDPNFISLNNGSGEQVNQGEPTTPSTLFSLFARADYVLKDKYMFGATIRRDGSSKFTEGNRFGVFPAISAGWRISSESFMTSLTWIDDLKIRAAWGTMGAEQNARATNLYNEFGGNVNASHYDLTGSNNGSIQGFRTLALGFLDTQWETNETTNIGIDGSFFNSKLGVTIDLYQKVTKDLLYNPPLPSFFGVVTLPFRNVGQMTNKGVELQVNYRNNLSNGLRYEVTGIFTRNKNNVDKVVTGLDFFESDAGERNRLGDVFVRNEVGQPISSFYGYKVIGINQVADTVGTFGPENAELRQEGGLPGTFKYEDTNNDGVITAEDKQFLGSYNPDFTYGLNVVLGYKNFDLTVFLYGVSGNEIINFTKWWTDFVGPFQGAKSKDLLYNSWTPERTSGTLPMASYDPLYSSLSTNQASNSYYVEKGSYLRARNIQIGYSLPADLLNRLGIQRARLYVQGVNLFTITDYSGLNPEMAGRNDQTNGVDFGNYPTPKQYTLGLNITL